ncbi:MAG: hypothetical protein KDA85_16710, partial [Planctomycetaceae bacterium]|nr:hypothetical protein [Planctomycetaceae bacterium]
LSFDKTPTEIHLKLFVDQTKVAPAASVRLADGTLLAKLSIQANDTRLRGIRLLNRMGDLNLRQLRGSYWDGTPPQLLKPEESRIHLNGGSIAYGTLEGFSEETNSLLFRTEEESRSIPLNEINSVFLSRSGDASPPVTESHPGPDVTHVSWADGGYVSGRFLNATDSAIQLQPSWSQAPLQASLHHARELTFERVLSDPPEPEQSASDNFQPADSANVPVAGTQESLDHLEYDGGSLRGTLVTEGESSNPLRWKPVGASNGSGFVTTNGMRIRRSAIAAEVAVDGKQFPDAIYLSNDDVLPCRLESWSEESVRVTTPFADAREFPVTEVRAVELDAGARTQLVGFSDPGCSVSGGNKAQGSTVSFRTTGTLSHPNAITGDSVSFHMKWTENDQISMKIYLFGERTRRPDQGIALQLNI